MLDRTLADFDWPSITASGLVDRVEYFPSLASTNDHARDLAGATPREERVLIVAERQTAGRGRGANRWWTGSGGLAFTLVFDPASRGIERRFFPMISLAAAIAVVETATEILARVDVGLHWPNDVFVAERKLAGVLIEALADGRHIVGIGCNINNRVFEAPPELMPVVTSLADLTGGIHARGAFLLALLRRLDRRLEELARSPQSLGCRANELCLQQGAFLTIRSGNRELSGICAGIAPDGALLLDTVSGRQALYSGVLIKSPSLTPP
jgi:BirA family transcriptional regulator, biotin operon repressor / biotin---[acetyl-CoA-carboxylase] ligase